MPWHSTNESCSSVCGDGLIVLLEGCDDNNNISGDGCSEQCEVEDFYECIGEPSNCSLVGSIDFNSIDKDGCNSFNLLLEISPLIPQQQSQKVLDLINIPHPNISHINKEYDKKNGVISIKAEYTGDITDGIIPIAYSSTWFNVSYSPMIPPTFYSQEECKAVDTIKTILEAVQIMSYIILGLGFICSCKIIGLELFGILQLAYFDLAHHDFFNLYLSPFTEFRSFNGINIELFTSITTLP